jgi:hypothetical protein
LFKKKGWFMVSTWVGELYFFTGTESTQVQPTAQIRTDTRAVPSKTIFLQTWVKIIAG